MNRRVVYMNSDDTILPAFVADSKEFLPGWTYTKRHGTIPIQLFLPSESLTTPGGHEFDLSRPGSVEYWRAHRWAGWHRAARTFHGIGPGGLKLA